MQQAEAQISGNEAQASIEEIECERMRIVQMYMLFESSRKNWSTKHQLDIIL